MKSYDMDKHNAIAGKLGVIDPQQATPSDAVPAENNAFSESDKSIVTISTINTINRLEGGVSALPSSPPQKSDGAAGLKDSLLSKDIAEQLADSLVFDEVSLDWHQCKKGIWQPISKTRSLKLINAQLHRILPGGFSLSKLSSVEAFLRIYLSLDKWETRNDLLPMQNGVLDIKKLELIDYSPKHRFRWQLPYEYKPDAKIDTIRRWLWGRRAKTWKPSIPFVLF